MKLILAILFPIIIFSTSFACDCFNFPSRDSAVIVGLEKSEIVFTGNLLTSDYRNNTYSFEIFEIFKGEYIRDTIWGKDFTGCSCFPQKKGIWIVYANMINDTTIDMDGCLYSMSLQQLGVYAPPLEPEDGSEIPLIELLEYKIQILESKSEHMAMWFADYEKLKKCKASSEQESETSIPSIKDERKVNLELLYLIIFLLSTNLILLILLIRKKKKPVGNNTYM